MTRAFRLAFAIALASTLASCRSTTEPLNRFSASGSSAGVKLSNEGSATVFYMVMDPGLLAIVDFVPCTSKAMGCSHFVAPHSSLDVPRAKILGGERADLREALVLYWVVRDEIMGEKLVGSGQITVPLD